jgi:hypothetical protein
LARAIEEVRRPTRGDPRVPPQNLDAEESVLGSMMLSSEAIADVVEILEPDDFYRSANGRIYDVLRGLYARGEPVDIVTGIEALRRAGILDDLVFFIDNTNLLHPSLAQGTRRGARFDVIAVADDIEDMQIAYGVDRNGNNAIDSALRRRAGRRDRISRHGAARGPDARDQTRPGTAADRRDSPVRR